MKLLSLLVLLLIICCPILAQKATKPLPTLLPGKLHVLFVLEHNELEFARLNMQNDTLMTDFVSTVQHGLNYAIDIRRLAKEHFSKQALQNSIAAMHTNPADVIILYYSGYGIKPANPADQFANWRLDDVKKAGLAVGEVETWLKAQKAHLSLLIADYSTQRIENSRISALTNITINLSKQIIHQLFIRHCGIVKLGSSLPSAPSYVNTAIGGTGSVFTSALHDALSSMLMTTDPAYLTGISFETLKDETASKVWMDIGNSSYNQPPVLEVKTCPGSSAARAGVARPLAGRIPGNPTSQIKSPGTRWQGLQVNEEDYKNLPQKGPTRPARPLPIKVDLSKYAPPAINQGDKGTCVAVSIGYYMRSVLEARKRGLTNKAEILKHSASPYYLYSALKDQNQDKNCTFGIDAGQALEYLKNYGLPPFSAFPDPGFCTDLFNPQRYPATRIKDYVKLFRITEPSQTKVLAVKQALAELSPVVVGFETTGSIGNLSFIKTLAPRLKSYVSALVFTNKPTNLNLQWQPYQANALAFGHAICVVGYDDTMFRTGAFKLINSWGSNWGDNGYFWISYQDFSKFAKYGYQAYLPTNSPTLLDTDLTIWRGAYSKIPLSFTPSKTGTQLMTYTINKPQPTGTSFNFRVAVKQQTYLYLITTSSTDSIVAKLLPQQGYKTMIAPNNRVDYPSDSTSLTLTGKAGLEYWLFLFSDTEIANLDEKISEMNRQKGSFPDRVATVFGNALIPGRLIDYKPKKMGFFLMNQPGVRHRIVPLLVTIHHVPRL